MDKRNESKKVRRQHIKVKLQHFSAVVFCIALLIFLINVTDMSTRRMMMCKDDKYALALYLSEDEMLSVHIAGEELTIDVAPVIELKETVIDSSRRYLSGAREYFENKLGK
ncbi:MAG: hypothetical protein ACM3TR_15400 [Caulobacteraceae bacterium]